MFGVNKIHQTFALLALMQSKKQPDCGAGLGGREGDGLNSSAICLASEWFAIEMR
jgi:hypothetical protein